MIKAIIFDIGDVLITNVHIFDDMVEEFQLDGKQAYPFYVRAIEQLEGGQINEQGFWDRLKRQLRINQTITYPSPLIKSHRNIKAVQGVINIVVALKQKGYKLGLLSNTIKPHIDAIQKLGFFKYFDVKIFSYEVKKRKPLSSIYRLSLKQLRISPEEAIFIDNNDSFIKGAEKAGIKGIRFINPEQLKRDLNNQGIDI